jgi:GH35 family endo-1,4-beta-xylanase
MKMQWLLGMKMSAMTALLCAASAGCSAQENTVPNTAVRADAAQDTDMYRQLQEEFKAVGKARFVFGGNPDEATQRLSNGQLIDVQGQPFTKAQRIVVQERQAQPWMVNMSGRNKEPIHKGDLILATFYARGRKGPEKVDTGTGAVVQAFFKNGGDQLTEYHATRELTPEWERYWVKSTGPVKRDYAAGEVELLVMLGHKAQEVEMGGLAVMAFPAGSNAAALPKPSYNYAGRSLDAPWRKEAESRIERLRKGNLKVQVVDVAGRPVRGAQVHAQMKKHDFLFGTAIALPRWLGTNMSEQDKTNYRQKIIDHFNMVETENELKWRGFTEWGMSLDDTEKELRWAREHGLYTRGHVLVWPSWEHTPAKVKEQVKDDPQALRKVVRQHVTDTVTRFKGLIDDWDVTNETEGNRDYMDILGPQEMIVWYQLARKADSNVKLTFTEPGLGLGGMEGGSFPDKKLPEYRGWVDYLVKNKAPLDRLGSQEHGGTMAKIGKKTDPAAAWKLWDETYKRYGKEIIFTELDVNIDDDRDEEQLRYQADVLRDTMILAFAHPHLVGINQWGFWENAHWFPRAALWRSDWSIKPNGQAYLDLVYKMWWTDVKGATTANGTYSTRGFTGEYEVTVTANGKTKSVKTALPRDGKNLKVTLN